ncbi:Cocaine esterase-like protein [Thioalkalivibrio nitratireducens DSM 14787]|uniref:Cocaine esterase-like protein n=1 Tax=Thioalkalivibrio nitratireducens (strain DSM 14787 / UNIQEM 213 / ALEN2) TaxID=1255043 RepID=L0E068_THIND|nr:Cocaine esterase-like protein [Thioalkalivibrio nitratireducens DSM 14787]
MVADLPVQVREQEHVWVPMSDGVQLAARIWHPDDAQAHPVPAILEYIPYRRRDSTRIRDDVIHRYFAGHGYACVRVDLRGSGDSEGVLQDEYLQQELDDGVEVIRWISEQPWCSGGVGMIGISWGGFNGLQIAAMRPPALKAVVSVCSTDDRYADDVHHMGGCLLGDNLSWASTMFAYNSLPPDPEIVGPQWRDLWFQRLEGSGFWLEQWLRHQRRDDYWQHGSICEDWSAVQCPVMAVSGWADGYSNAVFRLLANLQVPRLGLVGPWSHKYPHQGVPGPAIGFLQECLRWWDRWLKGRETGIMNEPMLRVWMQDSVPPTTYYDERPGWWVGEPGWPSPQVHRQFFTLAWPGTLEPESEAVPERVMTLRSPLSVGLFAGKWCSYAATPDLPHDQREEDGGAMVFTSAPLDEPLEILGAAKLDLQLTVDRPVAMVAARLSDVAPDDKTTRVTYGLLNLTHRDSSESPAPLEPGRVYQVRIKFNDVAQHFPAGHRLRLSLSTSYWPLAWPAPEPVCLRVTAGTSHLLLPVRPPRDADDAAIGFPEPQGGPASTPVRQLTPQAHHWRVTRDLAEDRSTLEVVNDQGTVLLEALDLEMQRKALEWYSYEGDDFNSIRGETLWERGFRRGDWSVRTVTRTVLTSTPTEFLLHAQLDAYEGERRVYSRNWDARIPRDLV